MTNEVLHSQESLATVIMWSLRNVLDAAVRIRGEVGRRNGPKRRAGLPGAGRFSDPKNEDSRV